MGVSESPIKTFIAFVLAISVNIRPAPKIAVAHD